jgi:nicotinate-nucleotide adenylyltransferase
MSETLAVFGGSFDPPHLSHTLVAAYVLAAHDVSRVLVVPTRQHPFDKQLSPFEHRLRMCELAMEPLSRVEISDVEGTLAGPSLTLHMLQELYRLRPDARLRLVIGSDLLKETPSWHAFERVAELAPPIVVPRGGHSGPEGTPALPAISSTEVRRRLRAGEPTDGWLSPRVAAYALQHRLYADGVR